MSISFQFSIDWVRTILRNYLPRRWRRYVIKINTYHIFLFIVCTFKFTKWRCHVTAIHQNYLYNSTQNKGKVIDNHKNMGTSQNNTNTVFFMNEKVLILMPVTLIFWFISNAAEESVTEKATGLSRLIWILINDRWYWRLIRESATSRRAERWRQQQISILNFPRA